MAGVASFFVSRIDTQADEQIEAKFENATDGDKAALQRARGRVAVANARVAYQSFKKLFSVPRWEALAKRGARPQRLLFASTGVKDPAAPDTMYVTALAAPNTVDTMPEETLLAFGEHGSLQGALGADGGNCEQALAAIAASGVDLGALGLDGVAGFVMIKSE